MNKILMKLYNFMYDRYGIDELYKFLVIIWLLIAVINIFTNNIIINLLELIIFIFIIYRVLSKNKIKRRKENEKYLQLKKKLSNRVDLTKRKWNDRNTHIYKKCPKCKKVLRLPLKKGKHTCKCPKCGNTFKVRVFRNEKIEVEIIKDKKK